MFEKLASINFVDVLRFRVVCSSWNKAAKSYISAAAKNNTTTFPQAPWLAIPIDEKYDGTILRASLTLRRTRFTSSRTLHLEAFRSKAFTAEQVMWDRRMGAW
ncbi:unnamed protein product [Prunus armeniaca]|nr:hypothetical protein GBA52_019131 [Prunus armeniaca]